MKQSLPDIVAIYRLSCVALPSFITEKYRARVPVEIGASLVPIAHFSRASCEAELLYDSGGYTEKAVLQFATTEELDGVTPLAFVITDAQGQSYVIGAKEKPYPMVEVTRSIDKDTNVNTVKVSFSRRKSLVPCLI